MDRLICLIDLIDDDWYIAWFDWLLREDNKSTKIFSIENLSVKVHRYMLTLLEISVNNGF